MILSPKYHAWWSSQPALRSIPSLGSRFSSDSGLFRQTLFWFHPEWSLYHPSHLYGELWATGKVA